jgi:hypothetical protein
VALFNIPNWECLWIEKRLTIFSFNLVSFFFVVWCFNLRSKRIKNKLFDVFYTFFFLSFLFEKWFQNQSIQWCKEIETIIRSVYCICWFSVCNECSTHLEKPVMRRSGHVYLLILECSNVSWKRIKSINVQDECSHTHKLRISNLSLAKNRKKETNDLLSVWKHWSTNSIIFKS